jgi:exopolysaccharide production protein ExoQ
LTESIGPTVYYLIVLGLFWLDREPKDRTSAALWVPIVWMWIACSRSVADWLEMKTPTDTGAVLEGNPVDRAVYAVLLALGLAILVGRRRGIGKLLAANWLIIAFYCYALVTLLWSDYPDVAIKRWFRALGDVVMIAIVVTDPKPLVAVKRLLTRTGYVLIPLSVMLIKYRPDMGRQYGFWDGSVTYVGVTTNKNTLGAICVGLGLAVFWRFLSAYRKQENGRTRRMIARSVMLVMVLWLFRKANAMTSLSSFSMGAALLVLINARAVRRRPNLVHLVVTGIIFVTVAVLFLGMSPEALHALGRNSTLTDRTAVWSKVLDLAGNPILGTGFESFWLGPRLEKMWNTYWWHPNQAHNGYLEIYLNLGWVGIFLLAAVLVRAYRSVFRDWRNQAPAADLRLVYFLVGVVFNFTEAAYFRMQAPLWFFILLAITYVPALSTPKVEAPGRGRSWDDGRSKPDEQWALAEQGQAFWPVTA